MLKSIMTPVSVVALAIAAWLLLPLRGQEAVAQSAPLYINAVDIDVVPTSFDKFMAALKVDGTGTIQEAGCRELDVAVSQKDPHHVFIFEAYTNLAAWNSHQLTAHFLKFYALTAQMMTNLNIRPFSSVAMNGTAPAQAGLLMHAIDLDIVPAKFDAFMAAAKVNGAATPQDSGAHEFNIATLQQDPHHVLFLEVYDNAAAVDAHRQTDHFKAYQAATKDMVAKRSVGEYSSVMIFTKGK
jgi:quinol monooxygenase YgiN